MKRVHSSHTAQTGHASRGAIIGDLDSTYIEDPKLCLSMCDAGGPIDAPTCTPGGPTVVTLEVMSPLAYEGVSLIRTCTTGVQRP